MSAIFDSLENKTMRYVRKMPYLKALMISELQNDVEIYRYINNKDINFKNEITENFLNGLRGGMNELFTDFKKQFEKIKSSQGGEKGDEGMDFGGEEEKVGAKSASAPSSNYQVSIMYEKYYVRKKEIADNVLMIAICNTEQDGSTTSDDNEFSVQTSSFNLGQLDILFADYEGDFKAVETAVEEISKNISATM